MLLADVTCIIDDVFHYKLFEINRTPITLSSIMLFTLLLLGFLILSRALQRAVLRRIFNRIHINRGTQFESPVSEADVIDLSDGRFSQET